jgi:putative ABC transport system permease protein
MNPLLLAFKNVLRNRRRSVTTILVCAIGCAAILVAGGFALYTYTMLADNAVRESGHITIADKRFFEEEEETPMQFGIEHTAEMIGNLERDRRIEFILPRLTFSGLISNEDKSVIFSGIGADINAEVQVRGEFLKSVAGDMKINDNASTTPEILIGKDLARSLNAHLGSSLTLMATTANGSMNAIDVVVSSIITTGWNEADRRLILVNLEDAQRLLMTKKVNTLSIYLLDAKNVRKIQEELSSASGSLITKPWSEQAYYYASVRELYNRIFGLLGIIIALLVLFSVCNTLATSVTERTREIGTFRALGTYPCEVMTQFVHEGMLIGIFGVLIGNIAALMIVVSLPFVDLEMPPPPGRSIGYPLLVATPMWLYVAIDVLMVLLCCAAAWFSSRKAAKMHIMEALRHV